MKKIKIEVRGYHLTTNNQSTTLIIKANGEIKGEETKIIPYLDENGRRAFKINVVDVLQETESKKKEYTITIYNGKVDETSSIQITNGIFYKCFCENNEQEKIQTLQEYHISISERS
ncbi:MAG: hypothetical protein NTY80_03165 [candidate division SR1 bacterium]|nr:hypothetical protein [candidate division SR1 bacterium]